MSDRRIELSKKRANLRRESALQREELRSEVRNIRTRLAGVDHGIDVVKKAVRQPLVLAGGLGLIMALGPKKLTRWLSRGLLVATTGKRLLKQIR